MANSTSSPDTMEDPMPGAAPEGLGLPSSLKEDEPPTAPFDFSSLPDPETLRRSSRDSGRHPDETDNGPSTKDALPRDRNELQNIVLGTCSVLLAGSLLGTWYFVSDRQADLQNQNTAVRNALLSGEVRLINRPGGLISPPAMISTTGTDGGKQSDPGTDTGSALTADPNAPPVRTPILAVKSLPTPLAIPALPVEDGFRSGKVPRFADLPTPEQIAARPLSTMIPEELLETTAEGYLPVIAPDGRMSWRTFARPFSGNPNSPRIAIIVTGLGQNSVATRAAIDQLPPEVTLAFSPYGSDLYASMLSARTRGHETLMDLSVEPVGPGLIDPGPLALRPTGAPAENLLWLRHQMGKGIGYVGVVVSRGTSFADSASQMRPILEEIKMRGLLHIHSGDVAAINDNADVCPPVNQIDSILDSPTYQRAIDQRLATLEDIALRDGHAIGTLKATPLALTRLSDWIQEVENRGLVISPVSAIVISP